MIAVKIIFWLSVCILFYSYIGYGILVWLLLKFKRKQDTKNQSTGVFEPAVTLVVAAFNEAGFIETKILNSLALDYPADKLVLLFVADGSEDATVDIIKKYPRVQLHFKPERQGKSMAINRIMPSVSTDYVIFSDANTLLNTQSIREIVKHYRNPAIGAVAGEKIVQKKKASGDVAGNGEGLYWKYESFLKKLDAAYYSVVGAAGELFSIRTELFEPVAQDVLLDDFIISMNICKKGYRVMYEPAAFATESPSFSLKDEQKRKVRIAAGGFQSVLMLKDVLNIFKYGKLSFQYISHRVLRWVVCPWLLPLAFVTNIVLLNSGSYLYTTLFVLQCIFYAAALLGAVLAMANKKIAVLYAPFYFVFMNWALYLGFARFLSRSQTVLWEKARRAETDIAP